MVECLAKRGYKFQESVYQHIQYLWSCFVRIPQSSEYINFGNLKLHITVMNTDGECKWPND